MPTILTLEMSEEAARKLVDGWERKDPRLLDMLKEFEVDEIKMRDQIGLLRDQLPAPVGVKVFQFSLVGWDGGETSQDHLVKWVKAPSRAALNKFIAERKLKLDSSGIDDDLSPAYDIKDGVDCVLDEDGKIVKGDIGEIVPV